MIVSHSLAKHLPNIFNSKKRDKGFVQLAICLPANSCIIILLLYVPRGRKINVRGNVGTRQKPFSLASSQAISFRTHDR